MGRFAESDRLRPLHKKAEKGDLKAGRQLIEACRRNMFEPQWEDKFFPNREIVETHVKRRKSVLSGRQFK